MPAAVVAAALEHVEKALQVGVDIGMRIDQRMPHAGLRGEMHDLRKLVLGEQRRHAGAVGEVELDEAIAVQPGELGQPRLLKGRVVVAVDVVETDHGAASLQQAARDMEADEACRAGDEDGIVGHHSRHSSTPAGLPARSSFDLTSSTRPSPFFRSRVINGQPCLTKPSWATAKITASAGCSASMSLSAMPYSRCASSARASGSCTCTEMPEDCSSRTMSATLELRMSGTFSLKVRPSTMALPPPRLFCDRRRTHSRATRWPTESLIRRPAKITCG